MAIGISTMPTNSSSAGARQQVGRQLPALPARASAARGGLRAHARPPRRRALQRHVLGAPGEAHRLALGRRRLARVLADHGDEPGGRVDLVEPVVALEDAGLDACRQTRVGGRGGKRDPLGPHRRRASAPRHRAAPASVPSPIRAPRSPSPLDCAAQHIGLAEEARDERRGRPLVGLVRRARSARRGPGSSRRCGRDSAIASDWSCVTRIVVVPSVRWIWRSSICISSRSLASRLESGSSSSSMRGRMTSARASATRCCWPPDMRRG